MLPPHLVELARLEAQLARHFSDRAAVLAAAHLDENALRARRAEIAALLAPEDAREAREAFRAAFERARRGLPPLDDAHDRSPPPVADPASGDAPGLREPDRTPAPRVERVKPSYLVAGAPPEPALDARVRTPEIRVADVAGDGDVTALPVARTSKTLPFVEGDARAFIESSRRADVDEPPPTEAEEATAAEPASGDATQALDLRSLRAEAMPFQLEVERSLPAFVEMLVALTAAPGQEDEIGSRFGVHTAAERERVLAGWRKRWDAEPPLRAEWQRLYEARARATGGRG